MLLDSTAGQEQSSTKWHAIYTRHQHEHVVARILASRGFETLLPLYQSARRWKDRTKLLSLPLFPCYVFLRGGIERRLDIMTTPGVCTLVSIGGQPAAIPPAEIDAIRRVVETGLPIGPHASLKVGEWVRVKSGPLEGMKGILVRKKNICRLILSVQMLGKGAAVEVSAFEVEPLNDKLPLGDRVGAGLAFQPAG